MDNMIEINVYKNDELYHRLLIKPGENVVNELHNFNLPIGGRSIMTGYKFIPIIKEIKSWKTELK